MVKSKKIIAHIGRFLLIFVIVLGLLMVVPNLFGIQMYNVVNGSMEPQIPVGSLIGVRYEEPSMLESGQVITFIHRDSIVTHRVVSNDVSNGELITKGDANAQEDMEPVLYNDVIGQVCFHVPILGAIFAQLSTLNGKIFLLSFAALGALMNVIGSKKQEER